MLTLNPSDLAMQLKILILNQHLQTLGIALAQVKTGNTFKSLLNKIRQIISSLCRAKEITIKNLVDNIMNSIKL